MWLKQEHAKGSFTVTYLLTSKMPANGLIKALPRQAYKRFLAYLNLHNNVPYGQAVHTGEQRAFAKTTLKHYLPTNAFIITPARRIKRSLNTACS